MPRSRSNTVVETAVEHTSFGRLSDGTDVDLFTLAAGGLTAVISTYGAVVRELWAPGCDGPANVVLGYRSLDDYVADDSSYMGAIVGRYANRIANARFELDGVTYEVSANEGANCLHGGTAGFDKRGWRAVKTRTTRDAVALTLRYESSDGEEGFPGAVAVAVTYTAGPGTQLRVDYHAVTDRPTVVNLTSHLYWQLAGEGSGTIDDHVLTVGASHYLPVSPDMIPTGEVAALAGTPLDFTTPTAIGARIAEPFEQLVRGEGYDHHFVLDGDCPAARLEHPASGRVLEIETTEPGVQVYSGNHLDGAYGRRGGMALEPQHCPDSPHHLDFPSTVLRPGQTFSSTTTYRLTQRQ
jgi:aldose 1-epimerase